MMKNATPVRIVAVVPAAGIGQRMQLSMPKQYLKIGDKTVLEHTILSLLQHPAIERIILILHPQDTFFHTLSLAQHPQIQTTLGGQERADSVLAGLALLNDNDWALVHDAARPCLHQQDLNRLIKTVLETQEGGILAAPVSDTIKRATKCGKMILETVDRQQLWRALTPQLFPAGLLKSCLQRALAEQQPITDEASALEYSGFQPRLIAGRGDNIKITRQEDIALAQFYLLQKEGQSCE